MNPLNPINPIATALVMATILSLPAIAAEVRHDHGVHIVPLRDGKAAKPFKDQRDGYELRAGQFNRGTQFTEEPEGWIDGDPCWKYTDKQKGEYSTHVWEFVCD